MKNLYDVLGVAPNATLLQIVAAFRRLSKKFHPDMPGGDAERFKEIAHAYEVLKDPKKRAAYDRGDIGGGEEDSLHERAVNMLRSMVEYIVRDAINSNVKALRKKHLVKAVEAEIASVFRTLQDDERDATRIKERVDALRDAERRLSSKKKMLDDPLRDTLRHMIATTERDYRSAMASIASKREVSDEVRRIFKDGEWDYEIELDPVGDDTKVRKEDIPLAKQLYGKFF